MKRLVWRGVATILVALLYGWINLLRAGVGESRPIANRGR
jgi:hypothetical protein